jgi:hypothetical protein
MLNCYECREEAGYDTCICGQETGEQIDAGVPRDLDGEVRQRSEGERMTHGSPHDELGRGIEASQRSCHLLLSPGHSDDVGSSV